MFVGREGRALTLLLVLVAARAGAAGPNLVLVGSGDCRDPDLLMHLRAMSDALAQRLGPRLMDEDAVRERLRPESSRSLDELRRQLDAAQNQFYQADFQGAETATNAALKDVNRLPPGQDRVKLWTKAQLLLALLYRDTNRADASDEAFRRVLRLTPDFQLDQDFFSPSTRTRFEKLRKELASTKKAKLEVKCTPPGADVYLDGVKLGRTPYAGEVIPGSYSLTLVKGDAQSFAKQLQVVDKAEVFVDLEFEGSVQPTRVTCLADRGGEDVRLANAQKLGTILDVQQVALLRLDRTSAGPAWLATTLVDIGKAQKLREGGLKLKQTDRPPAELNELVTFVVTGERTDFIEPPPRPDTPREEPVTPAATPTVTSEPPRWQRPTAMVLGGVGVVGLAAGAVFQLNANASRSEFDSYKLAGTDSIDPARKYEAAAARDRANSQQSMAFVGFGAGAIALGAAAFLWFTAPDDGAVAIVPAVGPRSVGFAGSF